MALNRTEPNRLAIFHLTAAAAAAAVPEAVTNLSILPALPESPGQQPSIESDRICSALFVITTTKTADYRYVSRKKISGHRI